MSGLAEYFANNRYKPTWFIGDRVFGKFGRVPFVGTVGNDTVISEREGPRVSVFLDLPITVDKKLCHIIFVKPSELKQLKQMDL
jgi:hypothetical protein